MFKKTFQFLIRTESGIQKRDASQIGFIGIGQMGARMVNNLLKNGQNLKIYDVAPAAAQSIKGAKACTTLEEVIDGSDVVITMLPNGKIVKDTILGDKGILKKLPKGTFLLDCSTIEPQSAQELHAAATDISIRFMDAPVSGGVTGAQAGTLCFMVGGEEKDVKEIEPTLLHMGAKVYHCGKPGAGQIAKICNNLILGITMIGTSEAMNLGAKLGLDPKLLTNIVNISTGRSWTSETYNPVPGILPNVPSSNNYEGGFGIPLMAKDLGLAENAALSCGASVPLTAATHQIYRAMISNGYKDKDFSAIYQFLKGTN